MSTRPPQLRFYEAAVTGVWSALAGQVALVALAFSLAVTVLMVRAYSQDTRDNPLVNSRLQKFMVQLDQHPEDTQNKDQIRQEDQAIRQSFFHRRAVLFQGGYLLLGGLAVMVLALRIRTRLNQRAPNPLTDLPPAAAASGLGLIRKALGAAGLLLAGGLGAVALMPRPGFTTVEPEAGPAPAPAMVWPAAQEFMQNWPWFRGAACGVAPFEPPEWDGAAGKNVLWKAPVPLPGHNSPVVWKGLVFLSGATAKEHAVYCYNADSGALVWKKEIPSLAKTPKVNEDTGYAPSTVTTDGQHVFAIFVTGDVAALDFSGKILWTKSLGVPVNKFGHAQSLLCCQGRLIVQYDQGSEAADKKSFIQALDVASGKAAWKTPRPVGESWASPILIRVQDKDQIVTAAKPWVIAYDPANGQEIWRVSCLDGDIGPSPAASAGTVFVANQGSKVSAIRSDGKGDVTASHVLWSAEDGMPDTVSPLATGELVFLTTSAGTVTCYDAKDGKKQWEQDLDAGFYSSPVLAGKTVCLTDRTGVTHRFEAARKYKDLGSYPLGEAVNASPAFVGGKMFIRGEKNLFCIGKK